MTFGLRFKNTVGSIVVSSEIYGLGYIGHAQFTNTQPTEEFTHTEAGYDYIAGSPNRFYIYTIASTYPPVVFMQLLPNTPFRVSSVMELGGGLWRIVVGGTQWATPPILKCFARLAGPGGPGYGMRLRDAGRNRTWDTTERMLGVKISLAWAGETNATANSLIQTQPLSGVGAPYVLSVQASLLAAQRSTGAPPNVTTGSYIAGWYGSASSISRRSDGVLTGFHREEVGGQSNALRDDRTYIIDGNDYL